MLALLTSCIPALLDYVDESTPEKFRIPRDRFLSTAAFFQRDSSENYRPISISAAWRDASLQQSELGRDSRGGNINHSRGKSW